MDAGLLDISFVLRRVAEACTADAGNMRWKRGTRCVAGLLRGILGRGRGRRCRGEEHWW